VTNSGGDVPGGPTERFERLYADSVTALLGFCLRRCDSREDAADLVAEVFLVAWRRIEQVPRGDEARLWLFGVAHRLLANQQRALRRERNLGARLAQYLNEVSAPDPAVLLDRHEDGQRVRSALATLAPQDSALLALVVSNGGGTGFTFDKSGARVETTEIVGRAAPDVTSILVHRTDGLTVTATVRDGLWAAWWPGKAAAATLTVQTRDGRSQDLPNTAAL
jgi:RNA polymerase sigma-70 factor (ECF subfamily)